jgi:hypothetical protein
MPRSASVVSIKGASRRSTVNPLVLAGAAPQLDALQPVEVEQCALYPAQLSQGHGQADAALF